MPARGARYRRDERWRHASATARSSVPQGISGPRLPDARRSSPPRADQQHRVRFFAQLVAHDGVVAAFVLAAQDHPEIAVERIDRFHRGVDAGCLGIVVIADAADRGVNSRRCSTALNVRTAAAIWSFGTPAMRATCGRRHNVLGIVRPGIGISREASAVFSQPDVAFANVDG
jgi:hypothetical protein